MRTEEARRKPSRIEWNSSRVFAFLAFVAAGSAAISCSSSDGDGVGEPPAPIDASVDDAGDGAPSVRDAGAVDLTPRPIACASPPCAAALVTTLGATPDDRSQGFCALLEDGTVACWGANGEGQLGRGADAERLDSAHPQRVVGLSDVVRLDHTCAIDKSGAVWCWGRGPFLRPDAGAAVTTERAPVKLDLPRATRVGLGHATACAAVEDGLLCWGSNADAQLSPLTAPSDDAGAPTSIPMSSGPPIVSIAVGRATFVLREDGTLVTWGANPPLGRVSSRLPDPYPLAIELGGVRSADLAHDDACATAGGIGYCWGARVLPPTWNNGSPLDRALPEPVVAPEPLIQIATTRTYEIENIGVQRHRWCATAASGSVYCWGSNESGQAGDGTDDFAFDAVKVEGLPEPAAQVKTTADTTCALLTNGKIYCWGGNYNGQLGNGQVKGRSLAPVEVMLP
ncbi:MAG: hypothetical protein BGO98_07935 [Myxococcales bacterium 68-20]|nr:MAG: hypothetical protein BGO98_07935 [Myxococcales bacterium 68-20]